MQIVDTSLISVFLVRLIILHIRPKSLCLNKLLTIPHLESGFDVVLCAPEIKPDCSVMSAIVFQNMLVPWLFRNHVHQQAPDGSCMHL